MRSSTVAAVVALAALLSGGVAPGPAGAQGWRSHDRPHDDDRQDDEAPHEGVVDDGGQFDDGWEEGGKHRVPDDVRRYDFEPNQHRHPTLDGSPHDGRRADPLPPSQQPPPMQPYWGTMRPYWKPIDPSITKQQGGAHKRRR